MTTETPASDGPTMDGRTTERNPTEGDPEKSETAESEPVASEPTAYRVRLDRETCEGVFACLVRDDRFGEAADGLATIDGVDGQGSKAQAGREELTVTFVDDRLDDARQAARACPVDAIEVTTLENAVDATGGQP